MDNELDLNLDNIDVQEDEKLKVKNRFQQLSEKVKLTSQEKEELAQAKTKLEGENADLSKERDFYKDFSANVSKYPNASEYQDQILEKVKAGYSTEDAMVSVLNKEGKLSATPTEPTFTQDVAGGSAQTTFQGDKALSDMKPEEKFAALSELDKSGALADALRGH